MSRSKTLAVAAGATLLIALAYLAWWPVAISPEAWSPQPSDPEAWSPSGTLENARRVELPDGHGPEDVAVDHNGRIFAGLHDGRILRWENPGVAPERLTNTGGRPLGLHWDQDGRLLVADAHRGLLRVDSGHGHTETLATTCGGRKLVFTDDVDTAADGGVWFSDASERFAQPDWRLDILENRPNGRLCVWKPAMGSDAREFLAGLYFANGVAIDPGQQFILVNETSRYRVRRVWIAGPRAGQHEVLIDNLPGFPDGISTGSNGLFWIALASPRKWAMDATAPWPRLRQAMVRLPRFVLPAPSHSARVVGIDAGGKVIHDLYDPEGKQIHIVTSAQERAGYLYLGSLVATALVQLPVPKR